MEQAGLNPTQPKKSRSVLKWTLLGCGGLFLVVVALIGGWMLYADIAVDPARVESLAQDMLIFEKPPMYKGMMSFAFSGARMVMLTNPKGGDDTGYISLMSVPMGTQEEFEKELRGKELGKEMRRKQKEQGYGMGATEQLPSETFKVRGRDTPAQVMMTSPKGSSPKNLLYTIALKGRSGGLVILTIKGSESKVRHEWVQKFLDSVK